MADSSSSPATSTGSAAAHRPAGWRRWTLSRGALVVGVVVLVIALVGIVFTNVSMDAVYRTAPASLSSQDSLYQRLAPGILANPAKYMAAVNGGGGGGGGTRIQSGVNVFAAGDLIALKETMDRWEGLACIGLAILAFVWGQPKVEITPDGEEAKRSSVAMDFAPFLVVAGLIFLIFSFLEIS